MKLSAGRKNFSAARAIRTVSDSQLRSARCLTVSRGDHIGSFAVFLETSQGERVQISHDLSFRAANELKERYLQRRFFLQHEARNLKRAKA